MVAWQFVGRERELQRIRRLITEDGGGALVIAGPAGVGKTRLVLEYLQRIEAAGHQVIRARATSTAAEVPFGALVALLPARHRTTAGAVDDRADLIRRAVVDLAKQGGDRPAVLFIDDAHLLDSSSATLVHQLVTARAASAILTVRTGTVTPDAITALWKEGLAGRMDLGALPDGDVAHLISASVGGPIDPAAVAALTGSSQGNALFLREVVLGAVQDGTLAEDNGIWRLRRPLVPSERLTELVEQRLGQLDQAERDFLELEKLADTHLPESLERRDLLTSRMNGRRLEIRLAHPLYGEVLRAATPAVQARKVARSLAEVVEATGCRRRGDALRVACWRLTGGGGSAATMLAGAEAARWCYDFPLAERLASVAADLGGGFEADLLAGQMISLLGRREEAEAKLLALVGRATDDTQRARIALTRYNNSVVWQGSDEGRIFDEAMATITDPRWRNQLEALHLIAVLNHDGPRAAVAAAAPLQDHARGVAQAFACLIGSFGLGRQGRITEALDVAERGYAIQMATDVSFAWYPWWHKFVRCAILGWAGRFDEAAELAAARHREAVAHRSIEEQAVFALVHAFGIPERGDIGATTARVREAAALHFQLDRPTMVRASRIYEAFAHALAGRATQAEQALAALDALDIPSLLDQDIDAVQARAWTAVAAGDLPGARRHLERSAHIGAEIGDLVGETAALHGLARLGWASQIHDHLADRARHVEGDLAATRSVHTAGLVDGDAEALQDAARRFASMGAHLLAAEALADTAVVYRRHGDRKKQTALERQVAIRRAWCEGATTPALQAVEIPAGLTPAERDTALLAASGRSNREIADELYLSVRTVENRLQRVYHKLGTSGRDELGDLLASSGS